MADNCCPEESLRTTIIKILTLVGGFLTTGLTLVLWGIDRRRQKRQQGVTMTRREWNARSGELLTEQSKMALAKQDEQLKEKERDLAALDGRLNERDRSLTLWGERLIMREKGLSAWNERLNVREGKLNERDRQLEEKQWEVKAVEGELGWKLQYFQ